MTDDGQFAKFHKVFLKEIYPLYGEIEKARLKILKEYIGTRNKYLFVSLIIFAISLIILITSVNCNDSGATIACYFFMFSGIAIAIAISAFCKKNISAKKYKNTLKDKILKKILYTFGDITWLNLYNNSNIDERNLMESGLFARFNKRITDDEFIGTYNDISFRISETSLVDTGTEEKDLNTQLRPVFKGVIMLFDCNKAVKARTVITSDWDLVQKNKIKNPLAALLGNHLLYTLGPAMILMIIFIPFIFLDMITFEAAFAVSLFVGATGLYISIMSHLNANTIRNFLASLFKKEVKQNKIEDKVILEDPKFNKRFSVYSSDQVEARYLCTTVFMDRLYNLKTAFETNKLKCSFYNLEGESKLMIVLHTTKDLFELGDFNKPIYEDTTIYKFYREINSIYQIIDALKLNSKTGL